jgi:uncharacterized membrane protein (UPF0127 family)
LHGEKKQIQGQRGGTEKQEFQRERKENPMIHITNETRRAPLAEHVRVADTFWTRLRGLIGVRKLESGDGLLIKPARQIHTHFMSIPIDVVYVDPEGKVIDCDERIAPWKIGRLRKNSAYVIELPAGEAARRGLAPGDQLRMEHTLELRPA